MLLNPDKTRSFNLKVSAGVRAGGQCGEYSLKINNVKKMKIHPGIRVGEPF